MKNLSFLLLGALLICGSATAQTVQDEIDLFQSIWGKEKKALVAENLKLSEDQQATFYELYELFLIDRNAIGQRRLETIAILGQNMTSMNNEKADALAAEVLKQDADMAKIRSKYYKKFKKGLSPLQAAQWLQMERYIDVHLQAAVSEEIPLIGS